MGVLLALYTAIDVGSEKTNLLGSSVNRGNQPPSSKRTHRKRPKVAKRDVPARKDTECFLRWCPVCEDGLLL